MFLRISFKKVLLKEDFSSKQWVANISNVALDDLAYLGIAVNNQKISYKHDKANLSNAFVEVDIPCLDGNAKVEIGAILLDRLIGDFNEDFSSDFSSQNVSDFNTDFGDDFGGQDYHYSKPIQFHNIFDIFGYDLGNSQVGHNNPDFTIYFVSNPSDFNEDFSSDFNFHWETYANGIIYRKPYTNEIFCFDNTSSSYKNILWKLFIKDELIEQDNTRNTMFCSKEEVVISVTKNGEDVVKHSRCSCSHHQEVHNNQKWTSLLKQLKKIDEFSKYISDKVDSDLPTINNVSKNVAYSFLTENIARYRVNDELVDSLSKNIIIRNLYNHSGLLIKSKTDVIEEPYSYSPHSIPFEFQTDKGDYLLETICLSYSNCGELKFEKQVRTEIDTEYFVDFKIEDCQYVVSNNSFEDVIVNLFIFGSKEFEKTMTVTLPKLTSKTITINKDGVYYFEVVRGAKSVKFPFTHYCSLQKCIERLSQEILCENTISDKSTLILATSQFLFTKLHSSHIQVYYLEAINKEFLDELYQIKRLTEMLQLYCDECFKYDTDCKPNHYVHNRQPCCK